MIFPKLTSDLKVTSIAEPVLASPSACKLQLAGSVAVAGQTLSEKWLDVLFAFRCTANLKMYFTPRTSLTELSWIKVVSGKLGLLASMFKFNGVPVLLIPYSPTPK